LPPTERIATVERTEPPRGLPDIEALLQQSERENFPVALRVLPRSLRDDLIAIYGFARLTDDIGDRYPGDRLAALDWLESELDRARAGHGAHPLVTRAVATIARRHVDDELLRDLIRANRVDQQVHRYESFDDLLGYCRLSADPVGRLVLGVFGVHDARAERWSDDVCSALQVLEHLQDVGEDRRDGRVYLPQRDLRACGCPDGDLDAPVASTALRRVVAIECARARGLLRSGRPLVRRLHGWARVAVTGFVAGGLAPPPPLEAAEHDVLGRPCRPSKQRTALHAARLLLPPVRRNRSCDAAGRAA
jgi:squalene synthase HpnC